MRERLSKTRVYGSSFGSAPRYMYINCDSELREIAVPRQGFRYGGCGSNLLKMLSAYDRRNKERKIRGRQ